MSAATFCDCGHPFSYHHAARPIEHDPEKDLAADRASEGSGPCGWCPPHSHLRCGCKTPTSTGTPRNDTFNSKTEISRGVPKP